MLQSIVGLARRSTSAALVALSAIAGSAQAAVFIGNWDPAFGPELPSLGFSGTATFYIPDACLTSSGTKQNNAGCSSDDPMRVDAAQVRLYNLAAPSTILSTLTYAPPVDTAAINSVFVELVGSAYTVTSMDIAPIGPQSSSEDIDAVDGGKAFYLDFFSSFFDAPPVAFAAAVAPPAPTEFIEAFIYYLGPCSPTSDAQCQFPSTRARVTLTRVPEPGTIALVVGALGAGWVARRKRRA